VRRPGASKLSFEIKRIPSQEGLPPGDFHPYRHLGDDAREALFRQSLERILRETGADPPKAKTGKT
jgi:hypothetical protein